MYAEGNVGYQYVCDSYQASLEQRRRIDVMTYFTDDQGQLKTYLYPKACKWQPVNGQFVDFQRYVKKLDRIEEEVKDFESKYIRNR